MDYNKPNLGEVFLENGRGLRERTKDLMDNAQENISWEKNTQEKFNQLLGKIPIFLRGIAEKKVSQKAESLTRQENRREVTEKDMVNAFFSETPFGFHGPMKSDMEELGIDYTKYGHGK